MTVYHYYDVPIVRDDGMEMYLPVSAPDVELAKAMVEGALASEDDFNWTIDDSRKVLDKGEAVIG
jgi:hypothetical protein